MSKAEHKWTAPPPGQSGLAVCSVCGARKTPNLDYPDHPDHGCNGRPQDGIAQSYNESEYDPIP